MNLSQKFEQEVKAKRGYKKIAVCEVVRSAQDEKKPSGYVPIDQFWAEQGFVKHNELFTFFPWKEIGAQRSSMHKMVFWMKSLSSE